jgi:DNA polymerase-3 subunit alpha
MTDIVEYFDWKVRKGFEARGLAGREEYEERLDYETGVIREMGYESYLLVVADFITWARNQGIPVGPGRGSAAGCLISYCLGITNIDPIKYNLLFERFLNPSRISMPDIDVDFCKERVDEVIDYVKTKYGDDHVARIKTFGKLYAKSIIRDLGRVKELDPTVVAETANQIPRVITQHDQKLEQLYKHDTHGKTLKEMRRGLHGPVKEYLMATAEKLEELIRNAGTHAAGVIIGPKPLVKYMGLDLDVKNQQPISCFEMYDCERLGLVKFDFLSLDTLTQIDLCIRLVEKNHGVKVDIDTIPEDDPAVWKLLEEGRLGGIFQMGGEGFTRLTTDIQPRSIEDLAMISSIYRPGPMGAKVHTKIIKARRSGRPAGHKVKEVQDILSTTSGYIVYQEQIMRIANKCAGYDPGETDYLRKIIGKKLKDKMEKEETKFIQGMIDNGAAKTYAERIWKEMDAFGAYGFNKSHAVSYARISYETAWLKAHYPAEFLAASLSMRMDTQKREVMLQLMYECKDFDIPIMPPDINVSDYVFVARKNRVFYGLGAIKGLGDKTIRHILKVRTKGGPFGSMQDFIERTDGRLTDINTLDILAKSGAFDGLEQERTVAIEKIQLYAAAWREKKRREAQKKAKLFRNLDRFRSDGKARGYKSVETLQTRVNQELIEIRSWYDEEIEKINRVRSARKAYDILAFEIDLLGFYMQGHPLDRCEWIANKFSIKKAIESEDEEVRMAGMISDMRVFRTKKANKPMAILWLTDKHDKIKCVVFPGMYSTVDTLLQENTIVFVRGVKEKENEVIVKEVKDTGTLFKKGVRGANISALLDPGTASRVRCWLDKQKEANLAGSIPFNLELEGLKGAVEIEASELVSERLATEMDAKLAGLGFEWTK